jgi:hypothetical protein
MNPGNALMPPRTDTAETHADALGQPSPARRLWLAGAAAAAAGAALPTRAQNATSPLGTDIQMAPPRAEFVYEAIVDVADMVNMGTGPLGERRIVPITGGEFAGPGLKGTVLPGGADRQLVRQDGARLLDAVYELKTDDGSVITVSNQVLVRTPTGQPRYALSHIRLSAPSGKYGWLNDYVYTGTLDSLRPKRNAVLIRVFRLV